jgi:uncharacterized protein (DUF2141 family)
MDSKPMVVEVDGLRSSKGCVRGALFASAEGFPSNAKTAFRTATAELRDNRCQLVFDDVRAGMYAIAVHHDENSDGKVNTNLLGIPKEGFGMSKIDRLSIKDFKPDFDRSRFEFRGREGEVVRVKMLYVL